MAATHVFEAPPPGAASDWTMAQEWERFTPAEHRTWDRLVERHMMTAPQCASSAFLAGLDALDLSQPGIPDLRTLNARLTAATGCARSHSQRPLLRAPERETVPRGQFPSSSRLAQL